MSPLRRGQGHGAAYAGILSGVGAAPLQPAYRHRRVLGPFSRLGSDAERAPRIRGCPLLLRAGYACEGAGRERKREELSPL